MHKVITVDILGFQKVCTSTEDENYRDLYNILCNDMLTLSLEGVTGSCSSSEEEFFLSSRDFDIETQPWVVHASGIRRERSSVRVRRRTVRDHIAGGRSCIREAPPSKTTEKKFSLDDFELLRILGKGSFGKVVCFMDIFISLPDFCLYF